MPTGGDDHIDDPELAAALADPDRAPAEVLDRVHRVHHRVPIDSGSEASPGGGHVFVTETFTARSLLRSPRRAVLNLSGPVTTGSAWNIDVAGYDGGAREARRGFFAFTADYVGFGRSHCPANGATVKPMDEVGPMRRVLEHIRDRRVVSGVDVVCESIGGGIATQLAADPVLVRSAVVTTIMYTGMSELAQSLLLSPEYRAFLDGFTDGYMPTDAGYYAQFSADSPPEVGAWLAATQPGRYPTGFFLRMYEGYPYFDPGVARAPGLVLIGPGDFVPAAGDGLALSHDYGKDGAQLIELDGAGHVPRFEAANHERYWTEVFRFIDGDHE